MVLRHRLRVEEHAGEAAELAHGDGRGDDHPDHLEPAAVEVLLARLHLRRSLRRGHSAPPSLAGVSSSEGGSAGVPGGGPTPAGIAGMPIARLAWRELERTDVPHTMQND